MLNSTSRSEEAETRFPSIEESSAAAKPRLGFQCPCSALIQRLRQNWQATKDVQTPVAPIDRSLCLIGLAVLGVVIAGLAGLF